MESKEKTPLLPLSSDDDQKIKSIENDLLKGIKMGYPLYENGKWKWFFINLWRFIIFCINLFLIHNLSLFLRHTITSLSGILARLAEMISIIIGFPCLLLLLSFILGQYDYYYYLYCRHPWYKSFLSNDYILSRVAPSKLAVTSSHPYYKKEE
ncbi:unnamed protein product [Cunninghamella blakesleeana]